MIFKLPVLFILVYILISLLQLIASIDGIMHFFGLHWIFAGFAALLLVFIPAIGPLAGVYGAVAVWNWPPILAILLFFWPYLFYLFLFLFGTTASLMFWKKAFWPFYTGRPFKSQRPRDIEPEFSVKEESRNPQELTTALIEDKRKNDF